jgi:tRNA splicing ligase
MYVTTISYIYDKIKERTIFATISAVGTGLKTIAKVVIAVSFIRPYKRVFSNKINV